MASVSVVFNKSILSSDFAICVVQNFENDAWGRFKALPEHEQQIIVALKGVETNQQNLLYEYHLELLELKKKVCLGFSYFPAHSGGSPTKFVGIQYATLFKPLYDRRCELLAGDSKPDSAELDAGEQGLQVVLGKEFQPPSRRPLVGNGVANFWLAVFMNHPGLSMVVAPRDQKALEHLTDVRCTYFGGQPAAPVKSGTRSYASIASGDRAVSTALTVSSSGPTLSDERFGFTLAFYFSINEYFSNEILEKTYYYKKGQVNRSGELMYEKAVGCPIYWKSGMDLIIAREDEEDEPSTSESFFTFFNPKTLPSKSEVESMGDEEYSALLDDIDGDFDCGEDIRDEVCL